MTTMYDYTSYEIAVMAFLVSDLDPDKFDRNDFKAIIYKTRFQRESVDEKKHDTKNK